MKLSCIFLIFSLLQVSAKGFTQNVFITLHADNISLEQLFTEIEKQAEVKFLYRYENVAGKQVNINADNIALAAVLNEALHLTNMKYTVMENDLIVVAPENVALQGITVTGVVSDNEGQPLPGVNVTVKGTTIGISTDINGKFALQVPDNQAVLLFSYVGFMPQEITVGSQRSINITLLENMRSLDEVVVIGYGTRTKKDLTGAISQISSDEITRQVNLSPEFAMQGKMAGVMVSNTGSSPVARPQIRIRGVTTLGFNDPLYVIDGIPLTEGGAREQNSRTTDIRGPINVFSMINANDIESISVLKDASATAIYGVRASNGVILITTKRGSEGKPRVNLTASYGIQNIYKRYDVVSQQEYVDMSLEAMNNNPSYNKDYWYPLFDKNSAEYMGNKPTYSKDWMDAALVQNAGKQDYNLSVMGGNKVSNYAVGAGYTNQEDAIFRRSIDRYSFFLNSDHKITNWLKVGETYRFIYSTYYSGATADFNSVSFVTPWQPLYDSSRPDGLATPGRTFVGNDGNATFRAYGYGPATIDNFLGTDNHTVGKYTVLRNLGTFYAELSPLPGLRIKGNVSFDYFTNSVERYNEPNRGIFTVGRGTPFTGEGNTYNRRFTENINIVKEFLIGYNNRFGDHSVDLILNYMAQNMQWNYSQNSIDTNSPVVSWDQRYIAEGWDRASKGLFYERVFSGLIGYMGRLSYNYAQKYYFDATVRRDGTSKFGPGYKWGVFPSFAGAWRISSESFMENMTWMNDLKIRGGWGQTGNQETADFAFLSLINLNPKAVFGVGANGDATIFPAASIGNLAIQDMTWETVTTFSIGFDLIAWQNKLSFTAEYYSRNTEGILQAIEIPWTMGVPGSPYVNMATVSNSGFEFQAGYNDRFGDIGVHATANLTTVKNRVDDLYNRQRQTPAGQNNQRIESGKSMSYFYGYKTAGIFQTDKEVADWKANNNDGGNASSKAPGDVIFVDVNGAPESGSGLLEKPEPDGTINDYDRTYLGKSIAGFYYGITMGADYKNWDLVLGFRGVGDVLRSTSLGVSTINGGGQNFITAYRDRWTPTNTNTNIPRAMQNDPSGNNRFSDRQLHNASFLRLQDIQIGYNFKADLLRKAGITNLRCYLSGSNIFVISPFPELDPENNTTPTVFTFGVNLSF